VGGARGRELLVEAGERSLGAGQIGQASLGALGFGELGAETRGRPGVFLDERLVAGLAGGRVLSGSLVEHLGGFGLLDAAERHLPLLASRVEVGPALRQALGLSGGPGRRPQSSGG
jgi:hypothetical protein